MVSAGESFIKVDIIGSNMLLESLIILAELILYLTGNSEQIEERVQIIVNI